MLPSLLTVLSSVLIVLSFPPWGFYPLIWIALIPWLFALRKTKSVKEAFFQGLWLSILMSVFGFYWVGYVLHQFAELPWWLAIIGLFGYSLIGQPQFYLFAPLFRWLQNGSFNSGTPPAHQNVKRTLIFSFTLALLYTGIDWIIPKLFVDTLGHCFWNDERIRQAADLGGAALLTAIVYWVNDALAKVIEARKNLRETQKTWGPHLAIGAALVFFLLIYGQFRRAQIQAIVASSTRHTQIGVIQANIGDFDKVASESGVRGASIRVLKKFFEMSDEALKGSPRPDALVWPETSYPSTFRTPGNFDELQRDHEVEAYVHDRNVSLLFGGYDRKDQKDYNAFFFLSPDKHQLSDGEGDVQIYRKNILLLFGEYIPLSETFTFLKTAFPQVGNFGRGVGPEVLEVFPQDKSQPPVKVGPIICYEALFPNYILTAARKGSELILNITNDSWFGPYGEPILHFSLITFRSIEARLPQLRATNTGISALILPDGTISAQTAIDKEEIMSANVPITAPIWTLMKAWGDWFGPFSLVASLVLILWLYWRGPRSAS
jgi:apolipoprotein N-acyltransferase